MPTKYSVLYMFNTPTEASDAVKSLNKSGFNTKHLSLIGKSYHSDDRPLGFYTTGDRIQSWGGRGDGSHGASSEDAYSHGECWDDVWRLLPTAAIFFLPGLGLVAMAGPVVAALLSTLQGGVSIEGTSAMGAVFAQIGVPRDKLIKYDAVLKADKYLLMVHGSEPEVTKARDVMAELDSLETA